VWNAALISVARNQLLAELDRIGQIKIPVLGGIPIQIDASAAIAAFAALGGRLSPVAPLTDRQANDWAYAQTAKSLGLPAGQANAEGILNGLLAKADAAIEKEITARLTPLAAELAKLPPPVAAQRILAALPPPVADALKARYGPTLAGLIPADLTVKPAHALDTVIKAATAALEARYGKQIAANLASVVSWAGSVLSREVNKIILQMTIAGEQLDALTVGKGRKVDALARQSAIEAFDRLDSRRPLDAPSLAAQVRHEAEKKADRDDDELLRRLTVDGLAELEALQKDPEWPQGLRVEVDPAAVAPILVSYGDGPFFDALNAVSRAYRHKSGNVPLNLKITFDDGTTLSRHGIGVPNMTMVWRNNPESVEITLSRTRDEADALVRLRVVENVVR
jgi:hypothetical protein